MTALGDLPGGSFQSKAWAASTDGERIVGSSTTGPEIKAFLWDADNGMRRIQDVLANDYGLDLTGWTLHSAHDITPSGTGIVGYGTNPSGDLEGFRAVVPVPEPTATVQLWTVLVTLLALARRRPDELPADHAWRSPAC